MSRNRTGSNSLSIGRTSLVRLNRLAPAGGVENLLTYCWSMSHAAIPAKTKRRLGIEDVEDLWDDFSAALESV